MMPKPSMAGKLALLRRLAVLVDSAGGTLPELMSGVDVFPQVLSAVIIPGGSYRPSFLGLCYSFKYVKRD